MTRLTRLWRTRSGTAALEFGLVAGIFIPLCLGILDTGLLMWTKGTLQSTAALTARCAAISSPDCADARQFATNMAQAWIFPGIITALDVTPAPAVVCLAHAPFMLVTITCKFWAGTVLPYPLNGKILTAVAYFPVAAVPC